MGTIIGTIVFGAVIGVLARLVMPGKQAMGWIITVLIGIAGALIGYWVWEMIASPGNVNTRGIDWIRWAISIGAAVVLCFGYTAMTRKQ